MQLQWYGLISCSSGLAKTILQGTVKGGRRQGRQRKRWEDNIREWTGLEFAKSQRVVENRKNGGHWLWSHLWCPNDPCGWGIDEDDDNLKVHVLCSSKGNSSNEPSWVLLTGLEYKIHSQLFFNWFVASFVKNQCLKVVKTHMQAAAIFTLFVPW